MIGGVSIGTIVVAGILILAVAAIIRKLRRDKKNGASCHCGGDCGSCGHCGK